MFVLASRDVHGNASPTLSARNPTISSSKSSLTTSSPPQTTTITSSSTTPLPTACAASANYGLLYIEDAYDTESAVLDFLFPYDFALLQPGQCCALCSQTVGCYGFTTGSAGQALMYCELAVIQQGLSPVGPGVSPQCPSGRYSWPQADLAPYVPGATGGSGQGPCGIF
ncbi:hypothetical protein MMC11_005172 [Xylographa trunciseda]|nr:hypothetical protein [Xylographa trunciseda]